jgi:glucose-1-phosphate cytidylyltransferase
VGPVAAPAVVEWIEEPGGEPVRVVLFCGGLGMRLRDYSDSIPKPLVDVGPRPILWHLMSYYAHFGHKDFILCLGHGARTIKDYFLNYNECVSNDFVLSDGGRKIELLRRDIVDWRVTFVDTGLNACIGERLRAVRPHLEGQDVFLANYADGLSDLNLDAYVDYFRQNDATALFLSVPAPHTFHIVDADERNYVRKLEAVGQSTVRVNAGFFVLRHEIFDVLGDGEDLVLEPFERLIRKRKLLTYPYDGFWRNMDTFKDKQKLDELWAHGQAPWRVWTAGAVVSPFPLAGRG